MPVDRPSKAHLWLTLSLLIPLYYGLLSIYFGFSHPYIIQDDARQHVVWLQRLIDPQLFPNDAIAHYYQAIAPAGYKAFYTIFFVHWGISPLVLAKILPLFLALITSLYTFQLFLQILPVPAVAWINVLILNQALWLKDDLISSSPRALMYPIFAAFLYYFVQKSVIPCLVTILLQALIFPQMVLVQLAMLTVALWQWQTRSLQLSQNRQDYLLCLLGWAIALAMILPFSSTVSALGDTFTLEQMKALPEFGTQGRTRYFGVNGFEFIFGGSSGLRPPPLPPVIWSSLALPFYLKKQPQLPRNLQLLGQILLASLGLFLIAHAVFPKLYFPSRYTYHSLRFVMAIAASLVLYRLFQSAHPSLTQKQGKSFTLKARVLSGLTGLFIAATLFIPATPIFVYLSESWHVGNYPQLYTFLAAQPKHIVVASLDDEADNLPAFTGRSVLVSSELAFALHVAHYNEMRQRAAAILRSQYSPSLKEIQTLTQQYGVDFLLVNRDFLNPNYLLSNVWLTNSAFRDEVFATAARLQQGEIPALAQVLDRCAVVSTGDLVLVEGQCVVQGEG